MSGYPLEIPQLINPHPQGHPNLGVETRRRAPGIALDQKIELGLDAQGAQHDFRRQPGVAGVERLRAREQKVGCVATALHQKENVKGGCTRGRQSLKESQKSKVKSVSIRELCACNGRSLAGAKAARRTHF